ncbi:hypothetical protein [Roseovarius sp.]|uniref:hypothetical protein n=1 Tax=Roseovarius sp. TaxID=1486281 RepID=UPI003A978799
MTQAASHMRAGGVLLALVALAAACARDAEAAQRARLEAWFALGETVEFSATMQCAAGLYRITDGRIKAAMPVVGSAPEMARVLAAQGRAAWAPHAQVLDAAMVAMANADRPTGMAMRRAGLEARECMGAAGESAFHHMLEQSGAVLAWESGLGALILMDPASGLLVVAMGAR